MFPSLYKRIITQPTPRLTSSKAFLYKIPQEILIESYYRAFNHLQYLPTESILLIQEQRVLNLIKKVRNSVPFYKGYLARVETIKDFWKLPPVSKEEMKREIVDGRVVNPYLLSFKVSQRTSGSTGVPLRFFMDENMRLRRIALYRLMLDWVGKRGSDKVVLLMPYSHPFLEKEYSFIECGGPDQVESRMEYLEKSFQNEVIVLQSRTSYLIKLAKLIEEGSRKFTFRAIISYTEELSMPVRKYLERVFRAPVFDYYGCNEVNALGHECEFHNGLHVNFPWTYVEIVDKNFNHVSPGETGDIVVTSLDNEVMPFIRYQTGDRGSWIEGRCLCGRGLPLLKMEGRKIGTFILSNDRTGYAWELLWPVTSRIQKIAKYQAVRHSTTNFEIRILPGKDFTRNDEINIIKEMSHYLGNQINITLKLVNDIQPAASGKQQPFINLAPDVSES